MLFKSLTALTAATAAFAAPPSPAPGKFPSQYTLRINPGAGAVALKPLQLSGDKVVFGLESGNTTVPPLEVKLRGKHLYAVSNGTSPGEIIVAANGQLIVSAGGSNTSVPAFGWKIHGGKSHVSEVSYKGSEEFYSCSSTAGQEVYVLGSASYSCDEPFKFTIGATGVAKHF